MYQVGIEIMKLELLSGIKIGSATLAGFFILALSSPAQAQAQGIQIVHATYGGNVGADRGNVTGHITGACNRRASCTYTIDTRVIGDPVPNREKDYHVAYTCPDGSMRGASADPEAGIGSQIVLDCNARTQGIQIEHATYGGNVGAVRGNVTGHIAAACNRRTSCTYTIDFRIIGDPVPNREKDYYVAYTCPDGSMRGAMASPEAGRRKQVSLSCN